jgi:hypothetical protein
VFIFEGVSCTAGLSTVIADVGAGDHPTYTTTYTVASPTVTLGTPPGPTPIPCHAKTTAKKHPKHKKGAGTTTVPDPPGTTTVPDPPGTTVTASLGPLVETGS